MKHSIALVDDDQNILASVAIALEAEGFSVSTFSDGAQALESFTRSPPDLVVLDVKMPRMDGFEVLRRLRETSHLPVVFLTSRDEEIDEFLGLKLGADDYITKPFSQKLLVERIRAILRREQMRRAAPAAGNAGDGNIVRRGDLALDDDRHICLWRGAEVDMTVTEFMLVKSLAQKPGHVKSRAQLVDFAYGESVYVDDRTVDSHIKRIRRKFREVDGAFDRIETVYGVGYRLKDD